MGRPRIYVVSGFTVDTDEAGNQMQDLAAALGDQLAGRADVLYREYDDGIPAAANGPRTAIVAHSYGVGNYARRFLRVHPDVGLLFSIDGVACPLAGWPVGWLLRGLVAATGWGRISVPLAVSEVYTWRQLCRPPRGSYVACRQEQQRQRIELRSACDHSAIIARAGTTVRRVLAEWAEGVNGE